MPQFIEAENLAAAIERLQHSRAKPAMCEFLILKRALVRGETDEAILSSVDPDWKGAIYDFTLALPDGYEGAAAVPDPHFNPFGTAFESRGGWRSVKYVSNGPSDTVAGPGWSGITEQIPDAKPRRVRLRASHVDAMEPVVLRRDGELPKVLDAATWYFRFADLEDAAGSNASDEDVVDAFLEDVGLSSDEREILFAE